MPAFSGFRDGYEVRKLQSSRGSPSRSTSNSSAASTTRPNRVAASDTHSNSFSLRRTRRRQASEGVISFVLLAEAGHDPVAEQIQREGHQEQRHADREDRPELEGAGRDVAEADLDDVR